MAFILTTIPDGNTFKQLIEILHQCVEEGNLTFSSTAIVFTEQSPQQDIIFSATLPFSNLLSHHSPTTPFNMGINLPLFRQLTKSILKKDKLQFEILTPTSDLQLRPSSKSTTSYYKFMTTIVPLPPDIIPDFKSDENLPYLTLPLLEFSKTCQDLSKSNYCTEFKFYTNKLILQGIHDSQVNRIVEFPTNLLFVPEEYLGQIDVSPHNMKALCKLVNLAPTATIKIFCESGVMKLLLPIGHLGLLRIYLFHLINKY